MKSILLTIAIAISLVTSAQITKVSLQASGLTCSMCSNSINKAIKKLDFVEKVVAHFKTYTFEISFKANSNVDFDMIRKKVEGAGFSVSGFIATIDFDNVPIQANKPVIVGSNHLFFINQNEQLLNGTNKVKLLDKGFVSVKESKANSFPEPSPGTYHATIN
jgi:copper chaperone CopZ